MKHHCINCKPIVVLIILLFLFKSSIFAQIQRDSLNEIDAKFWISPYDSRQSKDLITSSISQIDGVKVENIPGANRMNSIAGLLTGFVNIQDNGSPGWENNSMYIRGLRTLDASNQPLIIVNGFYRPNAGYINPYDIESITVLKDAASTASFGLRGGNGVILITTKKGRRQPLKISVNTSFGYLQPTKLPAVANSFDYATLYNEALINDGGVAKYDQAALDAYKNGDDLFNYPNNNWLKKFYKKDTFYQTYNLNLRGGSDQVLYYVSAGLTKNSGSLHVDDTVNTYNTNLDHQAIDFRGNMDIKVTPLMNLSIDVATKISQWNLPGTLNDQEIMARLVRIPPNAFPIFNEDGSLGGTAQYTENPYGMINYSGYSINKTRNLYSTLYLDHKLDFIIKNLTAYASVSFDNYYDQSITRNKGYFVYEGNIDNPHGTGKPDIQQNNNSFGTVYRSFDIRTGLRFTQDINEEHNVAANLFLNQNTESGNGRRMPHVYKGLIGSAHYAYKNRYLLDYSFAYQGSEQIGGTKNQQFMFFPAVSLGWILTGEDFLSNNSVLSFMKLRGSYGITGLDDGINYYQKSTIFRNIGKAYLTGEGLSSVNTYRRIQVGIENIKAERFYKSNIGLDTRFFGDKLYFNVDVFHESGKDLIINSLEIPAMFGARGGLKTNIGETSNKGFEIESGFNARVGDLKYLLFTTFSFSRSKIIDMQEEEVTYSFNSRTGHPINAQFGLQADGLFYDDNEIASSPVQQYGSYKPGDIKYKDLNNDDIIDVDDRTKIGFGSIPEYVYGMGANMYYKGFDFSLFFQGVGNVDKKMSGLLYWEFNPNGTGTVFEHHKNRWVYDPAQNIDTRLTATYPRLTTGGDNNNNRSPNSDYWLKDASYLRLKNVEIGYSLSDKIAKSIFIENIRFFVSLNNILTFDGIKIIDPELTSSGMRYPIQKSMNFGINLQF